MQILIVEPKWPKVEQIIYPSGHTGPYFFSHYWSFIKHLYCELHDGEDKEKMSCRSAPLKVKIEGRNFIETLLTQVNLTCLRFQGRSIIVIV